MATKAIKREYKGYEIANDMTFGHKVIKSVGKGALPKLLQGSFTNTRQAEIAIDSYLGKKGTKDGESNATG